MTETLNDERRLMAVLREILILAAGGTLRFQEENSASL
jgi:hypothetical protein